MLSRCSNPTDPRYESYGGRGITVCERWLDIKAFVEDMGLPPEGMSLERIDNDGPYSPQNCRWATRREQQNNTRATRRVIHEGQVITVSNLARKLGLSHSTILSRLKRGYSKWNVQSL